MRYVALITLFATLIFACAGAKQANLQPVTVVSLHSYLLNPNVSFTNDLNYLVITNANDFHKTFYLTKASPGNVTIPDFSSQAVIAIILKPTEKVVTLSIEKAEIAGSSINIRYSITDTTSWKSFVHTPLVLAAVPKTVNIKQVNFYNQNSKEKTIVVH